MALSWYCKDKDNVGVCIGEEEEVIEEDKHDVDLSSSLSTSVSDIISLSGSISRQCVSIVGESPKSPLTITFKKR